MNLQNTAPAAFTIAKTVPDQMLVFGWGNVAADAGGAQIEDLQGDIIPTEELEKAAYDHVLRFRSTGEKHDPALRHKGRLVESCVFTREKQAAMGIPPGILPEGWWVGYKIDDPAAWAKIKSGEYQSFSVGGKGVRTPVEKARHPAKRYAELRKAAAEKRPVPLTAKQPRRYNGTVAKTYAQMRKFNPYHDEKGRFSSKNQFRIYSADRRVPKPWGENNSMAEHLDPKTGKISTERMKLYNQIINQYLAGVEPPLDGRPALDYMGGGGGSGKSYTIAQGVVQVPGKGEAVQINSDDIKLELPEFRQRAASEDPATSMGAANYVHEESSRIAALLTQAAMAKGVNIVVDGVASNPEKIRREVQQARENGYTNVRAHYISTPTEVAVESSMSRYYNNPKKDERRYVPPTVLRQAHKDVSAHFVELSELFDSVEVVQNDRSTPVRQIARKERGGQMEVLDESAYNAFLDKGR